MSQSLPWFAGAVWLLESLDGVVAVWHHDDHHWQVEHQDGRSAIFSWSVKTRQLLEARETWQHRRDLDMFGTRVNRDEL